MDRDKERVDCQLEKDATATTRLLDKPILAMAVDSGGVKEVSTDAGLCNVWAVTFLFLWYFFSGCTLFLNKYILTYLEGDATVLGGMQMFATLVCGYLQMKVEGRDVRGKKPGGFYRHMIIVGGLRFCTVLLGLVALNYVAVSFTETVKSSAPAFTVIISRLILGQITGFYVKLSLLPVMGGLAICSANELSFNLVGFMAALMTNISECAQNVYSKMLISGDAFKYSPSEMQFYTSVASFVVTLPTMVLLVDSSTITSMDPKMMFCLVVNGVFFHGQTIAAYYLMDYISPVTHSVANTGKRAFLIWTSVLLFGNQITFLSGLGTAIVILGVLLYNVAMEVDAKSAHRLVQVGAGKMFIQKV